MALWEKDPDEFYTKYLCEVRPPRLPQTPPMCVGSSFDAYVKSMLHAAVFGPSADPEYEFGAIFESQVEPHNRDFAIRAGKYCFKAYDYCGAYAELRDLLLQSVEAPRFETTLKGEIGGAPFLGKPDCQFILDLGFGRIDIILDWKVKSFCSKYAASPAKGYTMCRDGHPDVKSRGIGKPHKLYMEFNHRGMTIGRNWFETNHSEYADQCTLYGWLLGEPVGGEDVVVCIDELCAKPTGNYLEGEYPTLRIANHRARVSVPYQKKLEQRVAACWQAIQTGYVFPQMSREENDAHIEVLDSLTVGLASDGSAEEDFYNECTRPQYKR
jgi:hypothetical protein